MFDLIINNDEKNHYDIIRKLIRNSTKIYISVAFLKMSGLDLVKNDFKYAFKKGSEIIFVCGQNFYLTEPVALRSLYKLFKQYHQKTLFLYDINREMFHPKLYCFVQGKKAFVIVGSANFSKGGFQSNIEMSMTGEISTSSRIYNYCKTFIKKILQEDNSIKLSEFYISQYERRYTAYHKRVKKAINQANKEIDALKELNIPLIKKQLVLYNKDEKGLKDFKERVNNYAQAREILNMMCEKRINSRKDFMYLYELLVGLAGQCGLWYSGGLYRKKTDVGYSYKLFLRMVRSIRKNIQRNPQSLFKLGRDYTNKIYGLGVNVLTEIMNTFSPKRFAVLNMNPLTTLAYFGFYRFPEPNNFKPETYDRYNSLIAELVEICEFSNMGQVDHFMNYVYWKDAKKKIRKK